MSFRATELKRSHLVVLLLSLASASSAFGQAKNSPVAFTKEDAIVGTFVSAPNIVAAGSGGGSGSSDDTQWLKVEIHYGTTSALTTNFLDELQVKVWIEGRDMLAKNAAAPGQGVPVGLTGSVDYVNIPAGRDLYAVFYVPPATLRRYSTERGTTDFERKFDIHAELYVGGTLMDAIDRNREKDLTWYQKLRAVSGMVYRQFQSPFISIDPNRYPPIKLPSDSSSQ
jgi:hypothetical protein